jgi:riboflavin kinase/FMN adenylyltransferase
VTQAEVVRGLDALERPLGPGVATVGTFDGVHRGHRLLIDRAIGEAERLQVASVAVTWDRHPKSVVPDAAAPPLLTSIERKVELLARSGVDIVLVLPLDEELRQWSPERFVADVFVGALGAQAVIVGSDWRFGHRAAGDVGLLGDLGRTAGFRVITVDRHGETADEASSTRARAAVEEGRLKSATNLLGRPHELDATVVGHNGESLEARIGSGFAVPPAGRYRGMVDAPRLTGRCAIQIEARDRVRIEAAGESPPIGESARLQFLARA